MKPVDMIDVRDEKNPEAVGDCFRCCIASLLELPVSEVPHFTQEGIERKIHWTWLVNQWLDPRGFWYMEYEWKSFPVVYVPNIWVYGIGSGWSPRFEGDQHAVVVRMRKWEIEIAHDPHPSRAGFKGEIRRVGVLVSTGRGVNG